MRVGEAANARVQLEMTILGIRGEKLDIRLAQPTLEIGTLPGTRALRERSPLVGCGNVALQHRWRELSRPASMDDGLRSHIRISGEQKRLVRIAIAS